MVAMGNGASPTATDPDRSLVGGDLTMRARDRSPGHGVGVTG
jgi:hypothetical protein